MRLAFPYMFAKTKVFIPGAIAAVITAELNCILLNPKFDPDTHTIAGCIINETEHIIIIGPISPAGRY